MADRVRRTDQPSQTKLRLEPHRTHRHHRSPNLVRTRRLRPTTSSRSVPSRHETTRSGEQAHSRRPPSQRLTLFQVEVASRDPNAPSAREIASAWPTMNPSTGSDLLPSLDCPFSVPVWKTVD